MKYALFIISGLTFIAGIGVLGGAKGAIHEVGAFVWFLICAVLFSSGAIVLAINQFRKEISSKLEALTPTPK